MVSGDSQSSHTAPEGDADAGTKQPVRRFAGTLESFRWFFLVFAIYLFWEIDQLGAPLVEKNLPRGIALQLAWSINDALEIIRLWKSEHLEDQIRTIIYYDFALIVCYSAALWGLSRIGVRVLANKLGTWTITWLPRAPLAAGALDVVENFATLLLLAGVAGAPAWTVTVIILAKAKYVLLAAAAPIILVSWAAQAARLLAGKPFVVSTAGLPDPATVAQVIQTELNHIAPRGEKSNAAPSQPAIPDAKVSTPNEKEVFQRAHEANLWGLALSGGGIRSATFSLGVIQALARADTLSSFHYLSTVSGGGYIGSWLSKMIYCHGGDEKQVEGKLHAPGRDVAEIRFLRSYSNYLTPRKGSFTVDTWTAIATYMRNLSLNLIILVGFAWAAFAFLLLVVFHHGSPSVWGLTAAVAVCIATVAMTLGVTYDPVPPTPGRQTVQAIFNVARSLLSRWSDKVDAAGSFVQNAINKIAHQRHPKAHAFLGCVQSSAGVVATVVTPLFLVALGGAIWWHAVLFGETDGNWMRPVEIVALIGFFCWAAAFAFASVLSERPTAVAPAVLVIVATILAGLLWLYAGLREIDWSKGGLWVVGLTIIVALAGWAVNEFTSGSLQGASKYVYEVSRFLLGAVCGVMIFVATVVIGSRYSLLAWYSVFVPTAEIPAEHLAFLKNALAVTVVPVIVLAGLGAGIVVGIGLAGNVFSDKGREWWARVGGWIMIVMIGWIAIVATPLAVPGLIAWTNTHAWEGVNYLLGSGWAIVSGLLTLFARRGSASRKPGAAVRVAMAVAPYFFAVGLIILLTSGLYEILAVVDTENSNQQLVVPWPEKGTFAAYIAVGIVRLGGIAPASCAILLGASFSIAMLFSLCVDVNRFSLHDFYRNRLVRCYLGASNPARHQPFGRINDVDPFTAFSESDDIAMELLRGNSRPYHIVNAAVNIVKVGRLAWQERKAAPFVFTPYYCGYALSEHGGSEDQWSFRVTSGYANSIGPGSGVTLGTAMAISGAAVSPNMGMLTTPAFAALMTVLNLRLGTWMPNPGARQPVQMASPAVAAYYLFLELFGLTDEKKDYVYLSDGGHFENLGVYELVRRRCRLILAVDAGADPNRTFEDIGNCIRKCHVDLGVRITLDVENLKVRRDGTSDIACVEGEIHYTEGESGKLIYVKPSNFPSSEKLAQLMSFHLVHKDFPHQSTADQWFDESQLESYRVLGELAGQSVIKVLKQGASVA